MRLRAALRLVTGCAALLAGAAPAHALTYAQTVIADGAIGYWRLGETSGTTAVDSIGTGNGNHPGTYSGGVTLNQPSALVADPSNPSVVFNGSSGSISIGAIGSSATTITWEFWFRSTAAGQDGTFISSYGSGTLSGPGIELASGALRVGHQGAGQDYNGILTPTTNVWHYVVMEHTSTTIDVWYDGAHQPTFTNAGAAWTTTGAYNILLGERGGAYLGTYFLNGNLDEVAIYNGALTPTQIAAHYLASTAPVPEPGCLTLLGLAGAGAIVRRLRRR